MNLYDVYKKNPVLMVQELFGVEPDLWQVDALESFASDDLDRQRISMQACAGPGKGNSASAFINTTKGLKKYKDLVEGDEIFSENGEPSKVVAIANWGIRDFYKVTFSDGSNVNVSKEHMWKVQSRHFKKFKDWELAETKELLDLEPVKIYPKKSPRGTDRKVRRFRIPIQGASHFTKKDKDVDLPIAPYLLGVWLGDGARNTGQITSNDECVVNKIKSICKNKVTSWFSKLGVGQHRVHGLVTELKKIKIASLYCGEKYIPDLYKYASSRQRREVLKGLLDTDGCIKENGSIEFSSTSKKLSDDFVWLARSLGCYAHNCRKVDTRKKNSDCYTATVRTDFNPFYIKRKADRWTKPPEYQMYRYIESIEKIEDDECICIEIDHPSHCYLANDFIVTHNSAVLAWIAINFLLCYSDIGEHPKGAAVSMTHTNLVDNLWSEINKWMNRNEFLKKKFKWTQDKIFAIDHKETWFISARSFKPTANKEERGRALSGLHAKYVLFLIDEAGSVPPEVGKAAEQALSNCEFGKILLAGNPTSHDGLLYEASKSPDWYKIRINGDPEDPMRSPRIDKKWAAEQIKKHGRDDPWVQSMILGRFPDVSVNTLLSDFDIDQSVNRAYQFHDIEKSEKRLGVDAARFGADSSIIFPRQGLKAFPHAEMRKADGPMLADRVIGAMNKWKDVDKVNVDGTGGYGSSCVDFLRQANIDNVFEINFSQAASNPQKFYNKRAEMYWNMAQWVKKKGWLPRNPRLRKELTSVQYFFAGDRIKLESKDQIKTRLGFSPDLADALALTFAHPDSLKVSKVPEIAEAYTDKQGMTSDKDYNPLKRAVFRNARKRSR